MKGEKRHGGNSAALRLRYTLVLKVHVIPRLYAAPHHHDCSLCSKYRVACIRHVASWSLTEEIHADNLASLFTERFRNRNSLHLIHDQQPIVFENQTSALGKNSVFTDKPHCIPIG